MTNDPWDDERLEAAYAARGEVHPTPGDLTASTMAAIRSGARPATVSRWPQILAAAAAVAVVIGGLTLAGLGSQGPNPGATTTPSDAAGEATAAPAVSGSPAVSAPTEVAGLTVISVDEAIAIRDAGVDGREMAVRGWYQALPLPCPSMDPGPSSPIQPTCANTVSWLMRDREDLGPQGFLQPTGPAVHADLSGVTAFATPAPADVVVIGHFDDRRAAQCPADAEAACRDEFVVDRICWVDGAELEISARNDLGGPTTSTDHEVATLVMEVGPESTILSAITVPGGRLPEFEPVIRTHNEYSLTGESGVWIVRMVVGGQPETYLVVDGTRRVYRMTPDRRVEVIGDPATSSAGPEGAWPPPDATMVDEPGVEIAVVDQSGHLGGLRSAGQLLRGAHTAEPGAPSLPPDIATKAVYLAEATTPGELVLIWSGSGCDRRAIVTIDEALSAIAVERLETPLCEGEARLFGLLLTFDEPVDAEAVKVSATHRVMPTP